MPTFIYFILWGALFFVMMRFGCGPHIMGHGHGHRSDMETPDGHPALSERVSSSATEYSDEHRH